MNLPVLFLINLLKGRIKIKDQTVPVIQRSYPKDILPCITIDTSAGSFFQGRYVTHHEKERLSEEIETELKLHVWCNADMGEEAREDILNQIKQCNYKCFNDHYSYCTKYNDGICESTESKCEALTVENVRTVKNKCPRPSDLKYENLFTKFNIDKFNYAFYQPYNLDDLSTTQKIMHSIIQVDFVYTDTYEVGGKMIEQFDIVEENHD